MRPEETEHCGAAGVTQSQRDKSDSGEGDGKAACYTDTRVRTGRYM